MNKKIILSLVTIVAVSAIAIGGTVAYFSDTEVSTGNTFTAGTIDLAVESENPWEANGQYVFANLEPSDSEDINVTLNNVGTNDVVIWKKVKVTSESNNLQSEPECNAEGGVWSGTECSSSTINDLSTQLVYSMKIGGSDNIKKAWDVRVSDVNDLWIPVGRLNAGASVTVDQNYYFSELAGNAYQGDQIVIDITFYAEQLNAPGPSHTTRGVVLENKDAAGDWAPIVGDGTWGILTWDEVGNYTGKAWGMNSGTYKLVYWNDPTEVSIGSIQTGIDLTFAGTYAGFNNPDAKYWVRPNVWTSSSDVNSLFEANLAD